MGRHSRPVLKYDKEGNLVDTFESVNKAAKTEGITASRLRVCMHTGNGRLGHTYKLGQLGEPDVPEKVIPVEAKAGEEPWERNGYFSIKGWAKVCL